MKKFIYGIWYKLRLYRIRNWAIRVEYGHIRKLRLLDLTKSEKEAIKLVWGSLGLSIKPLYYRLFKTVEKFDARYLSDDLYFPWMIRSLNPRKDSDVLTSSMRTPKPIIKQWCDPLMTFHKHCSCYSLLTLR